MRTVEDHAYSLSQLVSCEESVGLDHLALGMNPLGLNRVEPRALFGQKAAYDPHSFATVFDFPVVRGNPLCDLLGDVPGSVVPDQYPNPLARRLKLLAAPREEAGGYPAHGAAIHEAQPYLLELRHIEPVAGDGLRIGVLLGDRLLHQAQGLSCIAPTVEGRPRQPAEPGLVQETYDPLGATFGQADQSVAPPFFLAYSGSGEVIHLLARSQRTQATVFAEVSGFVVQELAQGLGPFRIEGPVNGMRTFRALPKRLGNPPLVEGVDGVAHRLGVAAQGAGDLVGVLASGAGEQDLATAQSEGIRRTQACLQAFALGVTQGTHKDRSFHTSEDKPRLPSRLEMH